MSMLIVFGFTRQKNQKKIPSEAGDNKQNDFYKEIMNLNSRLLSLSTK